MPDEPRMITDDEALEDYCIQVDHWLRLQGHKSTEDGAALVLREAGYTPEGAAAVIIAGRR